MIKSVEPPELGACSAEGLSFVEYANAFSTFCRPDERHKEVEIRWRKKYKQDLSSPMSQHFYVLPSVAERELAPCCRRALTAYRWWAWLDATLPTGKPEQVRKRLEEAKRNRPQWIFEDERLVGLPHLEFPDLPRASATRF